MKVLENYKEKKILRKIRKGDKEAFGQIYDVYVVRIFRFIYLKTSSKETAEDLTSETFLKCWKYVKGEVSCDENEIAFRGDRIGPFIYKVARNLIIDFYRKKQFKTVEINEGIKEKIPDKSHDALYKIAVKEEIEDLKESLKQLKDEYQEVIILRYIEDLNMKEITEITGKTSGSVRVLLFRALKSLKKVMQLRENLRKLE